MNKSVIWVFAILMLGVVGISAYFITGLVVKPKTVTVSGLPDITRIQVKKLMPQEVIITNFQDHLEITFNTAEPANAFAYFTFDMSTTFTAILKDIKNNKPVTTGFWQKEDKINPSGEHKIIVDLNKFDKSKTEVYMYILLKWNKFYIPYGKKTSLATGPLAAWVINLSQ